MKPRWSRNGATARLLVLSDVKTSVSGRIYSCQSGRLEDAITFLHLLYMYTGRMPSAMLFYITVHHHVYMHTR